MIKNNDFVALEFTGIISDTKEIFDTNIESDAKKANFNIKDLKPFILSVGHKMLPAGFDDDLVGKELNKEYSVEIGPEKAFGKRNASLVRMIPTKLFHQQKIDPVRGMQLALDGQLVKILSNSGGRTLVDFNNPLSGKHVVYQYKILRRVDDMKEKVEALQDFLLRKKFDFELKDKKVIFKVQKGFEPFVKLFSKKFEEILGLEVDSEIIPDVKHDKNSDKKDSAHEHSHDHDHAPHEGHSHTHNH